MLNFSVTSLNRLFFRPSISLLLAILVGFSGVKAVLAKSPSATQSVQKPAVITRDNSSFTIAQLSRSSTPLYGSWKLNYSVGGILYESWLYMSGYSGKMRTLYFDPNVKKTQLIDQSMSLRSSSQGLILVGYNPVYAGTNTQYPTYSADNFLFQISSDGSLLAVTCDDAGQCSGVDIESVR
ncbi:MAG TPA: hypothetical protein V6D15_12290 [Oculatellaceae cyanobacterium]|jgi:hypothetical protein